MVRLGKRLGVALISLIVLLAIAITLTIGWRPFLGPRARALTNRSFERTPQRLERGRYIATALSGCSYCHTPHSWTAPGTPPSAKALATTAERFSPSCLRHAIGR